MSVLNTHHVWLESIENRLFNRGPLDIPTYSVITKYSVVQEQNRMLSTDDLIRAHEAGDLQEDAFNFLMSQAQAQGGKGGTSAVPAGQGTGHNGGGKKGGKTGNKGAGRGTQHLTMGKAGDSAADPGGSRRRLSGPTSTTSPVEKDFDALERTAVRMADVQLPSNAEKIVVPGLKERITPAGSAD